MDKTVPFGFHSCPIMDENVRLGRRGLAPALGLGVSIVSLASASAAGPPSDPFGGGAGAFPSPPGTGACAQLTAALCQKQSTALVLTALGYVALSVLVAALLRAWLNKGMRGSGAARLVGPLVLAAAMAGTLVGLDPARGPDLACCLGSAVFRAEVLLADSGAGRVVLLGVLPAIVLYMLVVVIVSRIHR